MKVSINQCAAWFVFATTGLALAACSGKGDEFSGEPKPAGTIGGATAQMRAAVDAKAQFSASTDTAQAILALKEVAACSLENVVTMADNSLNPGAAPNSYLVGHAKAYKLIGFATNKDAGTVPATVRLTLVGPNVYDIDVVTGSPRPDVATYFSVPAFANAGYQVDAAFDDVAPGEYRVFALEGEGDARVACPTHQIVTVKE